MEIIENEMKLLIYGYGEISSGNYSGTAFSLMNKLWETIKVNKIPNKGKNIIVYEENHIVFAGVEITGIPEKDHGLESKEIMMKNYAYHLHLGPYHLIPARGKAIRQELAEKEKKVQMPYIEIYGHWTNDKNKLETELFFNLE